MAISADCPSDIYVDISKLIYQLLNGRVILERLPQDLVLKLLSTKHINSEIENTNVTEASFKDDKSEVEPDFEKGAVDVHSKDDERDVGYRVVRNGRDVRSSYMTAYCCNCKETFTKPYMKCPKCNKNYKIFRCGKCEMQYSYLNSLKSHVYYFCMPYETFFCRFCDYRTNWKCHVLTHLKKRHTQSSNYPKCGKQFANSEITANRFSICRNNLAFQINDALNGNIAELNNDTIAGSKSVLHETSVGNVIDTYETELNNVETVINEENADYRVMRKGDVGTKKKYFRAFCCDCNETFAYKGSSSNCPKCSKKYTNLKCGKCQAQFLKLETLRYHLQYKCMPWETYFCRKCKYQSHRKSKILIHIKMHKTNQCTKCGRQFPNRKSAKIHSKRCKKNSDNEMNENDADLKNAGGKDSKFMENIDYRVVCKDNGGVRESYFIAYCQNCNETFTSSQSQCSKCSNIYSMFKCGKCQLHYSSSKSLKSHLYSKCLPLRTYFCQKCNYQCNMYRNMERHLKSHSKPGTDVENKSDLHERNIDTVIDNKNSRSSNVQELTEEDNADYQLFCKFNDVTWNKYLTAVCCDCNKTFTCKRSSPYCPKCSKIYTNFKCGKCQVQFSKLDSLRYHLQYKCTPSRTYYCPKCYYQCHLKNKMMKHLKQHLPTKSSKCPKCQKEFSSSKNLSLHLHYCKKISNYQIDTETV